MDARGRTTLLALGVIALSATTPQPATSSEGRQQLALSSLTVPAALLPTGCSVAGAPSRDLSGNRVKVGLWGGLPIDQNPWRGTHTQTLVMIRERIAAGPTAFPDGPPPPNRVIARMSAESVAGVDEGYAAFYDDGGDGPIAVYALHFADPAAQDVLLHERPGTNSRLTRDAIVVSMSGGRGACSKAVGAYVRAQLAR